MLYALCASAGLRFGEALGIDISNISPDCTTIQICQKAWKGQIHDYLKSENGKREIDLHSTVAAMLKDFVGDRKSGLLFSTNQPTARTVEHLAPLSPSDINQPRTAENWMSRISSFPYHLASQGFSSRRTHQVLAWPRGKDDDRQLFQVEIRCGVSQASSRESGLGFRTSVCKYRCWTEWTETRSWTRCRTRCKLLRVILVAPCGRVAQLGEHLLCKQGVTGSIPVTSTIFLFCFCILSGRGATPFNPRRLRL